MSTVEEVLDGMAASVERSGLVQRFDALDRAGRPCSAFATKALRLGLTPSLLKAAKHVDGETFLAALYAFADAIGIHDHCDHNAVLAAVWEWEDKAERAVEDILDAIRRAKASLT